ncbi:3-ketoacyl-CoA synthase [Vigna angularis]|uniref:3-ketoacyl-CoA synthase n=1 Tax=Phaseolus angularis TaxID=3914 RepID=A0A8T0KWE4_PHAAN|nr:3-ketoacyl-CoA synthase [Vigna angularis]
MTCPTSIYLLDFSCYRPQITSPSTSKSSSTTPPLPATSSHPPSISSARFSSALASARKPTAGEEADQVMFGALDNLFAKTRVKPKDIGILDDVDRLNQRSGIGEGGFFLGEFELEVVHVFGVGLNAPQGEGLGGEAGCCGEGHGEEFEEAAREGVAGGSDVGLGGGDEEADRQHLEEEIRKGGEGRWWLRSDDAGGCRENWVGGCRKKTNLNRTRRWRRCGVVCASNVPGSTGTRRSWCVSVRLEQHCGVCELRAKVGDVGELIIEVEEDQKHVFTILFGNIETLHNLLSRVLNAIINIDDSTRIGNGGGNMFFSIKIVLGLFVANVGESIIEGGEDQKHVFTILFGDTETLHNLLSHVLNAIIYIDGSARIDGGGGRMFSSIKAVLGLKIEMDWHEGSLKRDA